jgi:hypothetical protein
MKKETLRIQMLSGIITESEYKAKLEEGIKDYPKVIKKTDHIVVRGLYSPNPNRSFRIYPDNGLTMSDLSKWEKELISIAKQAADTSKPNRKFSFGVFADENGKPTTKRVGQEGTDEPNYSFHSNSPESLNENLESSFEDLKMMVSSFDNFEDTGDSFSFTYDTTVAHITVTIKPYPEDPDKVIVEYHRKSFNPDELEKRGFWTKERTKQPIEGVRIWLKDLKRRMSDPLNEMESSLNGKKLFISIDVQSNGWSTNIQHECDIVKINKSDGNYFILASTPKGEKIKIDMEDQETLDGFLNGKKLRDMENPYNFIYLK